MDIKSTFSEHNSTTLEWTVKGLKHVFESTMGEAKSRSMFSEHFGHGRWRAQFMANSGGASDQGSTDSDGGWIGLFINCTLTPAEEKEKASSGSWVRDGKYHLTCEIQGLDKAALCVPKTEYNHSFSHKSSSWGWYKFASRNSVYFHSSDTVKQDAFVITCTVTAAPVTLHPTIASKLDPRGLSNSIIAHGTLTYTSSSSFVATFIVDDVVHKYEVSKFEPFLSEFKSNEMTLTCQNAGQLIGEAAFRAEVGISSINITSPGFVMRGPLKKRTSSKVEIFGKGTWS